MNTTMSRGAGSGSAGKITKIQAMEVLDSRGNPTVQTTVWAGEASASASVPSGASTGIHEALELRDNDKKRYGGKGVLKACKNVNDKIFKAVKGENASHQETIDNIMLELDGTENKSKLGANAILSVSLACARLAAKIHHLELYQYLREVYLRDGTLTSAFAKASADKPTLSQREREGFNLPTPLFNVINGGVHAVSSGLDVQEFFIIPQKGNFAQKLRMGAEVYHMLKKNLDAQGLSTGVGDEGGFAPKLGSNEAAFKCLQAAIKAAGYTLGKDFKLGTDAAASEFFERKKQLYSLKADKKIYQSTQIYKMYKQWLNKYHLEIIEDGCAEDDFLGWKLLTQNLGGETLLVGDDLFCTNIQRIQMGITQKIANAVLIKVNQIGSLTETLASIQLAQKNNYKIVISHRSGETNDSFISDLAVAVNANYIKAGSLSRGERMAKYNRLLEIEQQISNIK